MITMGLDRLTRMLRQRIPGLLGVYLFGSRAKGSVGPASDIDLAVLSDPPLWTIIWRTCVISHAC